MQKITDEDLSNESFPFRSAKDIAIGYARVMCARITYLGELGYELHIPCEHGFYINVFIIILNLFSEII